MNPLDLLSSKISSALETSLRRSDSWTDNSATARMVRKVRERHDGPGVAPNPSTVAMAVAIFRQNGEPDGWRGLKRVCFGVCLIDPTGWSVLTEKRLLERLLGLVQSQGAARKRMKCYQALIASYFGFHFSAADQRTRAGWRLLKTWLNLRLPLIAKDAERKPIWLATLISHRNLLQDHPCNRYGEKLLKGDGSELDQAVSGLGIPSDSWVQEEAVLAQIRMATNYGHDRFHRELPTLLSVAMGRAGISPSKSLQTRCVALLVSRYAKMPVRPEHPVLRDAAVNVIGNPWLRKTSWDATVFDENGRPDDEAREMVRGWLNRRLITDFFELLSDEKTGDTRRLDYWLRFADDIEDMWFALGLDARSRRGEGFEDFRARARGRLLHLEFAPADNNAFVMRMGNFVAIEFGKTGNALYMFRWHELPSLLTQKLLSGKDRVDVTINQLKSSQSALFKKSHRDSPVAMESWEQKFDAELCPLLGLKPEKRPAFVPVLEEILRQYSVDGTDLRPRGGALWVLAQNNNSAFNARMKQLGFNYHSGRGWSKE